MVSDSAQGGSGAFYDNNGGFDYHVPTRGSLHARPKLSVVHVAVEMAPIAKVQRTGNGGKGGGGAFVRLL